MGILLIIARASDHNENLNHRITDIVKNLDKIINTSSTSSSSKYRTSVEKEVNNLESKFDETIQLTSKTFEALDLHLSKLEE